MSKLPGKAHRPSLDHMTPAQIRVVCEELLYTMEQEQRVAFMKTFPGLYALVFPELHVKCGEPRG